ncbi:hypothetical protein Tco_1268452 [Tanacetum coccineum]
MSRISIPNDGRDGWCRDRRTAGATYHRPPAKAKVQTHRCIGHSDVEAQSIPKNIISPDPSHQGETFVKLVERHLSLELIDKLLATIFDRVLKVGSLEKSMAAKHESVSLLGGP